MFVDGTRRRYALVLACFASGLGWLLVVAKPLTHKLSQPLLVHNMLGNTFFSAMVLPHHVLAAAVLVGLLLTVLRGYQRGTREVFVPWHGWLLSHLYELCPQVVEFGMRRMMK